MPLRIQNIIPDMTNKRGNIHLGDPNSGDVVSVSFSINFTGTETLDQANSLRAKQFLQEAIPLL
jgi:hypothetical protein